ncbi:VOC family protein [Streptomyces albogriseolus]|uniref:VOC family protein n=1 Tax=Streptomyces albogriseolus TaxID=1887 RepID=UPI00368EB7D9
MSRVQLALRVPDLSASLAFYTKLFGVEPAKLRDGYANFAIAEPPLKLVLIEGEPGTATRMDHLGVEVDSTEAVHAATTRLSTPTPVPRNRPAPPAAADPPTADPHTGEAVTGTEDRSRPRASLPVLCAVKGCAALTAALWVSDCAPQRGRRSARAEGIGR